MCDGDVGVFARDSDSEISRLLSLSWCLGDKAVEKKIGSLRPIIKTLASCFVFSKLSILTQHESVEEHRPLEGLSRYVLV